MEPVRIATRKSPLALWQAEEVAKLLKSHHPGLDVELLKMTTKGDRVLDAPLASVGGKGLFVKELETGILEGRADIAVHSMKDVPMDFPPGLHLAVILERGDPFDAFVSNHYASLNDLPTDARIGTSSLRRQLQLLAILPNCRLLDLRGNVNSRLKKLDSDDYDAVILASAGLKRLGMAQRIQCVLDPGQCLPAVGQGAIGIECRTDDERLNSLVAPLNHSETATRVNAERAMNHRLNGGCQVPIAGFAELTGKTLFLRGLVGKPDGSEIIRAEASAPANEADALGRQVAEDLLSRGGDAILKHAGLLE